MKHIFSLVFLFTSLSFSLQAQDEKIWLRHIADTLCSEQMYGRGYVNDGRLIAAKYVAGKFKEFGLQAVNNDGNYFQDYTFPVNSFPGDVDLTINGRKLRPGIDFLVDAGSASFSKNKMKVKMLNLSLVKDSSEWADIMASFKADELYCLQNIDSLFHKTSMSIRHFASELPKACFIIPQHGKLTWTVARSQGQATLFYVEDTILQGKLKDASAHVDAQFIPDCKNENIIGIVAGAVKDTFIVFSAHNDHLGMMGKKAMFPGASDNASGTATLLYLANYFSNHPQYYSMAFISFSGEEAGLMGSHYFVQHPLIPLNHIRFLTNLDIMGDATDGVTVVNATEFPQQFKKLQNINAENKYLPAIKSRGKAANSDHYFFSEARVPAFFIYTNGGKGYYHDVFDKADNLSLNNIDKVEQMLIRFTEELNK